MRFFVLPFFLLLLMSSAGIYRQLKGARPNTVSYFRFSSQGQVLDMAFVYKQPARGNGQTVLLLQGPEFDHRYWEATAGLLVQQGYAVLIPEQIGTGASSQPLSYQFSFRQLALNTRRLLDSLGCKHAIVVGHAFGATLALRFALMYPGRCTQLVLENPLGLSRAAPAPLSDLDEAVQQELQATPEQQRTSLQRRYFNGQWRTTYACILKDANEPLSAAASALKARNKVLLAEMLFSQPVCYELKEVRVPVAVLLGEKDPLQPPPNAHVRPNDSWYSWPKQWLPGTAHIPHLENPPLFFNCLMAAIKRANTSPRETPSLVD